jgi:hypothetical protein
VKDADHCDAARLSTFNQSVLSRQVRAHIALGKVGSVAKRLLNVNHNQTGFHGAGSFVAEPEFSTRKA